MMRILLGALLFFPLISIAQKNPYPFDTIKTLVGNGKMLELIMHIPKHQSDDKLPLIVWLHGKGERNLPNGKQWGNGLQHLMSAMYAQGYKAIILAPHCPANDFWSVYDKFADTITFAQETPIAQNFIGYLNTFLTQTELAIDKRKIYIAGISMGGFGTWDWAMRYPQIFAAAIPICGGADPRKASKLSKIPVWTFHGEDDKVVSTKFTKQMEKALSKYGIHKFTYLPNVGHDAWNYVFKNEEVIHWLFQQEKAQD